MEKMVKGYVMMSVLVLGANGMLGHKLMQVLSQKFKVTGTIRGKTSDFVNYPIFTGLDIIGNVRADDLGGIQEVIEKTNPGVIINCIGIVKQLPAAMDPLQSIAINALFPHQLAKICLQKNIRLIHISTDCVFSGKTGNYKEDDPSDASDLYGKTKYLGELQYTGCLTLRTSFIGRELGTTHGLIEWFVSNEGKTVPGYKKAIFSGLTTLKMSEIISQIISDYPSLYGVQQIASEPISKYDLLKLVKKTYGMEICIRPDETVISNHTLNGEKFKKETNIKIPSWEYMVDQMYRDPTPYDILRPHHAHG
jgi:dTDP-4-dehydrorhamnose reductase